MLKRGTQAQRFKTLLLGALAECFKGNRFRRRFMKNLYNGCQIAEISVCRPWIHVLSGFFVCAIWRFAVDPQKSAAKLSEGYGKIEEI